MTKTHPELDTKEAAHISVNSQYIKDLSFENPSAPSSLAKIEGPPQISLALDLEVNRMTDEGFFEVEIIINAKATYDDKVLFIVDLTYGGVFNLINIPPDNKQVILAVHCPSIIFPFARKVIADVTQEGGFQPLMIDPVDFGTLYQKKMSHSEGN